MPEPTTTDWTDRPGPVRPGEELDTQVLAAFLEEHLGLRGPIHVEQFPAGFSNLTYLVRVGEGEDAREVVLRRPPPGAHVKGGHDMEREYLILSRLHGHVPVPKPLAFSLAEAPLGVPFYVMERVRGVILRGNLPGPMRPPEPLMARIADAFVRTLATLHTLPLDGTGLRELGRPDGYVARQVAGWTERYRRAQTDEVPSLDRVAAWLERNRPAEAGAALLHNDYKYDNLVLDPADWGRVVAVLDWEMATVGCPLMDLGSTLGYWVEPDDPPAFRALGLVPTTLPGNPTRAELVARYEEATGRVVPHPVFYYVYGLFKLAVIAQQIYARYRAGHTRDPRFGELHHAVRLCGEMAERAIERDRLSGIG